MLWPYHLFLDKRAFVEGLVGVLHVDEERAYAARGQTAVCGYAFERKGSGLDESELLMKVEDVLLQTL